MRTIDLYILAEENRIDIDWFSMDCAESLSIRFSSGACAIAIDPWKVRSIAEENVRLAHELGHCETGSFYNLYSPCDIQQKHENRADRWAIKKLVPRDELEAAVSSGYTEAWELADFFNVTEEFIVKAVEYYKEN